ncbi:glycosyltransferase family 2 protein, partial [bacterium]|nr:glycosyltransferase family 2 protein [bacterium]
MKDSDFFFKRCLDSLWNQSFQDFEIVVTDNSEDDTIKTICEWYRTGIKYFKNPRKGMAQNTNEAIQKSKGELIKILYMDDYMAHDDA